MWFGVKPTAVPSDESEGSAGAVINLTSVAAVPIGEDRL